MLPDRLKSVSSLLQQVISDIIRRELKDPRIGKFVSVTGVEVSRDLRSAKVFISALPGSEMSPEQAVSGLDSAKGFIRRRVTDEVVLKRIPFLNFIPDHSIERGVEVCRLIDQVVEEDEKKLPPTEGEDGEDETNED